MQGSGLPSHRALLTSLIASFHSPSREDPDATKDGAGPVASGAFRDAQRRRLLLTLHVIFPGMLLPAVDLLDRRLVARLSFAETASSDTSKREQEDASAAEEPGNDKPEMIHIYTVKSVASTLSRRRRDAATAGPARTHVVHLDAWNCSCAGFALEAIPGDGDTEDDEVHSGEEAIGEEGWIFGGMSLDGAAGRWGEALPCCKHLLACLLADKWRDVLNVHVEDKTCTREEVAGIVAGL